MATDPATGASLVQAGKASLKRLAPSDMVKLAESIRRRLKDHVEATGRAAGLSGDKLYMLMREIDRMSIQRADVVDYMLSIEGQQEALLLALRHEKSDATEADVDALEIPLDQVQEIVCQLGYFRLKTAPPAPGGGGEPNPTEGGSQSGTGTSSPTASA